MAHDRHQRIARGENNTAQHRHLIRCELLQDRRLTSPLSPKFSDFAQHVYLLRNHSRCGTMSGKGDMQTFPVCHRCYRAVILHADHFCPARALRLRRDPYACELEIGPRFGRVELPPVAIIGPATRLTNQQIGPATTPKTLRLTRIDLNCRSYRM